MPNVVAMGKRQEDAIQIGRGESGAVRLDLNALIESRMLICANSGSGKSTLMRLIVERAAGCIPFIILDWEGEFVTLREKYDVVLVGSDGEIAIDVRSARLLARKLIELHASAVIDLGDLVEPEKKRKYAKEFLDALIELPRALWNPTIICIDEAHLLCPESGKAIDSAKSVINLCSVGRKRNLCAVLASQRISKLHKDALAEQKNIFIGNTWLDIDQKRAGDILGISNAARQHLRDLDKGEFYAFGPALLTKGVQRFQADDSLTKPPKTGERHKLIIPKASDVVSHIVSKLADLTQKAEEEIKSLEQAQRRINELERALRATPTTPQQVNTKDFEKRYQTEIDRERRLKEEAETNLRKLYEQVEMLKKQNAGLLSKMLEINQLSGVAKVDIEMTEPKPLPIQMPRREAIYKPSPVPLGRPVRPVVQSGAALGKAERAILTVLAQYPHGKPKAKVAVIAGYSHNGGGFNNALGSLRSKGFIEGSKDQLQITDVGVSALGDFTPLPTGRELAEYWMTQLGKAERLILEALVLHYPNPMTKDELGRYTGYEPNGGGFNNALGKLRTLELISGGKDALKASENLF